LGIALGACGPDEEKVVIDIPGDNGVADGDNGTPGEDGDKGTPGEDGDKGTPGEDGDPVAEISCGGKLERVLKDGSGISVTMESKRVGDVCEVWAVQTVNVKKEKTRGFPLDKLHDTEEQTLSTCEAIGFGKDVELGSCPFGSQGYDYSSEQNFGKCGFPVSEYYRFGNKSTSNGSSNSPLTQYTLQSSMMRSNVITDFDGDIRTQCSIRTEGPDIVPCGEEAQTVETYTREDRGEEPKLHISMKTQIHVNDDGTVDDTVCDIWALQSYDPEEEEFEAPAPLGNLNAVKSPTMSTCEALGLGEDVELGSCKIRFDSNGRVTEDCGYGMKGDLLALKRYERNVDFLKIVILFAVDQRL